MGCDQEYWVVTIVALVTQILRGAVLTAAGTVDLSDEQWRQFGVLTRQNTTPSQRLQSLLSVRRS